MFRITQHKGFQIKFANNVCVSVQWGPGNYCEHIHHPSYEAPARSEFWESEMAEIAVWIEGAVWGWITKEYPGSEDNEVMGYCSPDEVLSVLNWAAAYQPTVQEGE